MTDEALPLAYDAAADVLTICGVHYSGHLFRTMSLCEPGTWLRFEGRRDGVVTVFSVPQQTERVFDLMVGKGPVAGAA